MAALRLPEICRIHSLWKGMKYRWGLVEERSPTGTRRMHCRLVFQTTTRGEQMRPRTSEVEQCRKLKETKLVVVAGGNRTLVSLLWLFVTEWTARIKGEQ